MRIARVSLQETRHWSYYSVDLLPKWLYLRIARVSLQETRPWSYYSVDLLPKWLYLRIARVSLQETRPWRDMGVKFPQIYLRHGTRAPLGGSRTRSRGLITRVCSPGFWSVPSTLGVPPPTGSEIVRSGFGVS